MKIYENKESNNSIKLDFIGITHPITKEDVIPTIQVVLKQTITKLKEKVSSGSQFIDLNETVGFLEMIQNLTEPNVGFYYIPPELGNQNE